METGQRASVSSSWCVRGIGAACARAFAAEDAQVAAAIAARSGRALAEELGGAPVPGRPHRRGRGRPPVRRGACGTGRDRRLRSGRRRLADAGPAGLGAAARTLGGDPRANLTATFLTARAFLREVARNGHGSLVLVGSTAGLVGEANRADYAAAKSAVLGGLLLSLKNEIVRVAPLGRVNAVAPGWTGLDDPRPRRSGGGRRISRTMALRKVAQPDDVAAQVVVLASDVSPGT